MSDPEDGKWLTLKFRHVGPTQEAVPQNPVEKIAYVRIVRFAEDTDKGLGKVLAQLGKEGLKGLILDLRFCPRSLLMTAVSTADLFIDDGVVVSIQSRLSGEETYTGTHPWNNLDFPMVCLVNGQTASSGEAVAACLKDHKRALILGERTRGDAGFRLNLRCEGRLTFTAALYLRPNGKKIDRMKIPDRPDDEWGVTPDRVLELPPLEKEQLAWLLRRRMLIPPPGMPAVDEKGFKDRQFDVALDHLRRQLIKPG